MGPTPTLPSPKPPRPTSQQRRTQRPGANGDRDPVLDIDIDPTPTGDPGRDADLALAETARRAHHELAEANHPRPAQEPQPPGRRLPEAVDAARQGVER